MVVTRGRGESGGGRNREKMTDGHQVTGMLPYAMYKTAVEGNGV